jgi:hypothetical protein
VDNDRDKVILLDPIDREYAFGINPLYYRNPNDLREQQLCFGQARDVFAKAFEKDEHSMVCPVFVAPARHSGEYSMVQTH